MFRTKPRASGGNTSCNNYRRRGTLRIFLWMVVPPVLLLVLALILEFVPLPPFFPPASSRGRHLVAALTTGVLAFAYVSGLIIFLISSVLSAGRVLDQWLVPLGFTSQNYMVFGSQYHGILRGRQMDVLYIPARMPRPAVMDIYVGVRAQSKIAIGHQRPLLDCQDCLSVEIAESDASQLKIFAQDVAWAQRWLGEAHRRRTLMNLMNDPATIGLREIYVQPDRVWFRAHIAQGSVIPQSWFDDLVTFAEGVETTP